MRRIILAGLLIVTSVTIRAQTTFKAGWNTYKTGTITREYTYALVMADSIKLFLADSVQILASADSQVTMTTDYPLHDRSVYKTLTYMNPKKLVVKKEDYKDENMLVMNEWRYDDKSRKIYQLEDDKVNGKSFKKTYEYVTERKTGETVVTENSYYDGRIEFYTKAYYNRESVKIKEIRLNDNDKDVVHIETYTYGENGKVKERTVYFPEWKVTKKFEEKEGNEVPKCFRTLPVGTAEKANLHTRIAYIKNLIKRNRVLLSDKGCHDFEYKFRNFSNCEIIVASTGINNGVKVIYRYTEKP